MFRTFLVRSGTVACLATFSFSTFAQEAPRVVTPQVVVEKDVSIPNLKDPKSYALGWDKGFEMGSLGLEAADFDTKEFVEGFLDGLAKKRKLSDQQLGSIFEGLKGIIQKRMIELGRKNSEIANEFLKANKDKDGVQTTKSGLQYIVLKTGKGKQPTLTSRVTAHYEGKLLNGTKFDSSFDRNMPYTFSVTEMIEGWQEALQRMKVGDKWKLFVPPHLGYKERGFPPEIGPNELLIFELEILEVK